MKRRLISLLVVCLLIGCNSQPSALVAIPDVIGKPLDEAQTAVADSGLVAVVKYEPSAETAGTVLRTDPPAGALVEQGGNVYLFVAADPTTTSVVSTAPVSSPPPPLSTTTQSPTTTSVPPATTIPIPTADPCAAGHDYAEGICRRCGDEDTAYVPTFALGETWTVPGQWCFTVLSITTHHLCNPAQNVAEGYTDQTVITIRYHYENLGFASTFDDLFLDGAAFTLTDADGREALTYGCAHKQGARICTVGESCTAEEVYVLPGDGSALTLTFSFLRSDGRGIVTARFPLALT